MAEKRVVKNYINGKSQESVSGQFIDLINPTTGEVFAMAARSNEIRNYRISTYTVSKRKIRALKRTNIQILGYQWW